MGLRKTARVQGSLQDIARLQELDTEACNVLLVSDRTLYLMANYAIDEVNFLSRYYTDLVGAFYNPVQPFTTDSDDVDSIANNFNLEVVPVGTLDGVIAAIGLVSDAILQNACDCPVGQGADTADGSSGGPVPGPIGDITFGTADPIADRKCKAANWIYDNTLLFWQVLDDNNIDNVSGYTLSLLTSTIGALIGGATSGPFGLLVGAVAGLLLGIAVAVLGGGLDFTDIVAKLVSEKNDLICALWSANTADDARDDFVAVLTAAGLAGANATVVALALPNAITNILFFSASTGTETELLTYPVAFDCTATCLGEVLLDWDFEVDAESWLFSDQSSAGGTAAGSYSGGNESLQVDFTTDGSPNSTGLGRWTFDSFGGGSLSVPGTCKIVVDVLDPSDLENTGLVIECVFTVAGTVAINPSFETGAQFIFDTAVVGDDLEELRVSLGRSNGGGGGDPLSGTGWIDYVAVVDA